jgi:hypothetical protein
VHQSGSRKKVRLLHVSMAPAMQEVMWRVVQVSFAIMCPACCWRRDCWP